MKDNALTYDTILADVKVAIEHLDEFNSPTLTYLEQSKALTACIQKLREIEKTIESHMEKEES
jgi:hypothetical protein